MADQNEVVILDDAGTEHVFPPGFDPQQAAAIVRGQGAPQGGGMRQSIADALPSAGGMVGGMVGGVPGAAVGGAAGAGFRSLVSKATELPGAVADVGRGLVSQPKATLGGFARGAAEGAADAGISGAVQGAMEGVGDYVVKPIAKGLYGTALRPIKAIRDKYGLKNLIDAGFENKILPTAGGAEKARKLVSFSRTAQRDMATAYDATGGSPLQIRDVAANGIKPILRDAAAGSAAIGGDGSAVDAIMQNLNRMYASHPTGMSAVEMIDAKHAADLIADPAYAAARRMGEVVPTGSEPQIAKGFSKGYRDTLGQAIGDKFKQQGQQTKTLYGLSEAAKRIAGERHISTNLAATGVGAGAGMVTGGDPGAVIKSALAYRALMTPSIQGATALALPMAAKLGMRGLDAATGAGGEDMTRQALIDLMRGKR